MTNIIFSQKEIEYLKLQRLARIVTAQYHQIKKTDLYSQMLYLLVLILMANFYVGGMNILKPTKYKNVLKNNKVSFVIDDLKSVDPWDPRGMKIYGSADIVTRQGGYMEGTGHDNPHYIRITPKKKWSWGIEEPVFVEGRFNVKRAKAT
jgi:pyridoxamine 5'-phosphate oxidase family protein